jgi:hypothetical protein
LLGNNEGLLFKEAVARGVGFELTQPDYLQGFEISVTGAEEQVVPNGIA